MAKQRKRPHNLIRREPTVCLNLRLPKSLHRHLKTEARRSYRSLHAELLRRLRAADSCDGQQAGANPNYAQAEP